MVNNYGDRKSPNWGNVPLPNGRTSWLVHGGDPKIDGWDISFWGPAYFQGVHTPTHKVLSTKAVRAVKFIAIERMKAIQMKVSSDQLTVVFFGVCTVPETNISPENRPSQKEISISTIHFQVQTVSFRGVDWGACLNPDSEWANNL